MHPISSLANTHTHTHTDILHKSNKFEILNLAWPQFNQNGTYQLKYQKCHSHIYCSLGCQLSMIWIILKFLCLWTKEGRRFRMAEVAIESYYHNRMAAICTVIWIFFPSMLALFVPIAVLILKYKSKTFFCQSCSKC